MPKASTVLIGDDLNRLPDGRDDEPRGWRDDSGSTPIEALKRYLDDRFEVDEWAWAESKQSKHSSGESSESDFDRHTRIFARLREVVDRHRSPAARARVVGSYGRPSTHNPSRISISSVKGPQRGTVQVTVDYKFPPEYRVSTPKATRYDFVKVDGQWRLHNVLGLLPRERPIGGVF